jgi:quinol monooxygenase YgiN
VSTPTDANPDLVTVIATLKAKAGQEDALRAALKSLIEPSKADEGNVNYDLYESRDQPGLFMFYENWESAELLGKHLQSPALQQALATAATDLLDGAPSIVQLKRIG